MFFSLFLVILVSSHGNSLDRIRARLLTTMLYLFSYVFHDITLSPIAKNILPAREDIQRLFI